MGPLNKVLFVTKKTPNGGLNMPEHLSRAFPGRSVKCVPRRKLVFAPLNVSFRPSERPDSKAEQNGFGGHQLRKETSRRKCINQPHGQSDLRANRPKEASPRRFEPVALKVFKR